MPGSPSRWAVEEVHPVDLVRAYGTLANGGRLVGHTTILTVTDGDGNERDRPGHDTAEPEQVVDPRRPRS